MSGAADDLDDLVRRVDPDRWLASRFIGDARARADVVALYAFDYETARAPRVASNALVGEMRLVWWREAVDEIIAGGRVRAHPGVEALARAVRDADLPVQPLQRMVEARYRELDPTPLDDGERLTVARDTAGAGAGLAARRLDAGVDVEAAEQLGAFWALSRSDDQGRALAEAALAEATGAARRLSAAAFPAVAQAVLARAYLAGRRPGEFAKRLRLVIRCCARTHLRTAR